MRIHWVLGCSIAAVTIATPATAQVASFDIAAQSVSGAVATLARQARVQVMVSGSVARGRRANAVRGQMTVPQALARLLDGTGLVARASGAGMWVVVRSEPAAAPTTSTVASAEPEAQDSGVSADIVVTAQRTAEPLAKVPSSVVALSRGRMDQLGVRDFADIAQLTPGVRLRPEINQIAIRGLASNAGAATTGVYLDETPIQVRTFGEGAASALPLVFDLDRVEVLRGPQGTLFGAGSMGGTVRYITPQPSLTRTDVYGRAELAFTQGGAPTWEAGAAVGMPIVEGVAGLRIATDYRRAGGWVDRRDAATNALVDKDANRTMIATTRATLRIEPAPGVAITPSVYYQRRERADTDQYWESRSDPTAHRYVNANPVPLANRDRFVLPSLAIGYDGPGFSVVSNTAWFDRRQTRYYDNTLYNFAGYEDRVGQLLTADGPNFTILPRGLRSDGAILNTQRNFSQELRIQSADPTARVQWLVGGFYSNNRQRNVETLVEPSIEQFFRAIYGIGVVDTLGAPLLPGGITYSGNRVERERQIAAFGNLNVEPIDGLHAQAGLRWSETRLTNDNVFFGPYIGATPRMDAGRTRERPLTPRFVVNYDGVHDLNLYASVAKGYRAGGINAPIGQRCLAQLAAAGRPVPDIPFSSDSAWSYEVGAKGRLAGLSFDASAFRIDWSNIQQRVTLDPCAVTYTVNSGQVRSEGFDLAVTARPTQGVTLDLSVGYVDARFAERVYVNRGATSGAFGIDKGNALFQAGTPWQVVVGGRYDFDLGGHGAFVRGNYEFSSRNFRERSSLDPDTAFYNPILGDRPATYYVRMRTGITFDQVEAQLFVDNLLDAHPGLERFNYGGRSPFFVNNSFRPRTIGLTLLYRQRP
ncbi:TonB-dependent receptor [uncultured Sphingomonas sp.]|uniref:TonB-dependent receptor domain-containing protein n=1 Tax=uncultured Sphingomonas sp. TaxID=158754 RepID=UPI0030F6BD36